MEKDIKKIIRDKLRESKLNRFEETNEKNLYENLTNIIDQYLSNYLVVGFDLENKPFIIAKNSDVKDDHALRFLATNFINRDWHSRK